MLQDSSVFSPFFSETYLPRAAGLWSPQRRCGGHRRPMNLVVILENYLQGYTKQGVTRHLKRAVTGALQLVSELYTQLYSWNTCTDPTYPTIGIISHLLSGVLPKRIRHLTFQFATGKWYPGWVGCSYWYTWTYCAYKYKYIYIYK